MVPVSMSFEEASQLSIFDYLSALVDRRRRATDSFEAELSSRPYTISSNHCKLGSCPLRYGAREQVA